MQLGLMTTLIWKAVVLAIMATNVKLKWEAPLQIGLDTKFIRIGSVSYYGHDKCSKGKFRMGKVG